MGKLLKFKIALLFAAMLIGVLPIAANNGIEVTPSSYNSKDGDLKLHFADSILELANNFKGYRYGYNMKGFGRFDCSGFTSYIFSQFGYSLNRSSRGQFLDGENVSKSLLLPGDLVFFKGSKSSSAVGHVGIVVSVKDNGFDFIHASRNGIRISSFPQENYYSNRYVGARRVLSVQKVENPLISLIEEIENGESMLGVKFKKKPKSYNLEIPIIDPFTLSSLK